MQGTGKTPKDAASYASTRRGSLEVSESRLGIA